MNNNTKIIIGLSLAVLIAFWWVEIRPVLARQECYDLAVETVGIDKGETDLSQVGRQYEHWLPAYNACLKNRGF